MSSAEPGRASAAPAPPPPAEPLRARAAVLGAVSAGGVLGALARYGMSRWWPTPDGGFPWTTFTVNVIGCFVIGCFLVAVTEVFSVHRLLRPFFGTGVLGGFTTFSTYCGDIRRLLEGGHPGTALAYLASTLCAALAAVSLAALLTRRLLGPLTKEAP